MLNLSKSYDFFQPEKCMDRIHIIGCGSVGATIAELLARAGLTKLTIWDFDTVEPKNLANQIFVQQDIGTPKVNALTRILSDINPDITKDLRVKPKGWDGEKLNGYVFLCVDNIDLRRRIVEENFNNLTVKAMFDFRTRLEDAQHYAALWSDITQKKNFLGTMQFTHEEAKEATPVSACNVELSVAPTVRIICALGAANFMNLMKGRDLKRMVLIDAFGMALDAI